MDKLETPLVSIRVPAYNHEKFIKQCLDSVLRETYPNIELVIMDDGSTDNTANEIDKWIQSVRPEFDVQFHRREHRGLCKTLNELISLCRGEYLVSLASDDILLPGGIQQRLNYLLANPEKSAVIGDCIVIDKNDNKVLNSGLSELYSSSVNNYQTNESLRREIIWNWSVPGPVLMVRKAIYKIVGGYKEDMKIEDWDFYLRMCSLDLLGCVDYKVSGYRRHDLNTSRKENNALHLLVLANVAFSNLNRFNGEEKRLLFKKALILFYESSKQKVRNILKLS